MTPFALGAFAGFRVRLWGPPEMLESKGLFSE